MPASSSLNASAGAPASTPPMSQAFEPGAALAFALILTAGHLDQQHPLGPLALDLVMCSMAALSRRWPRASAVGTCVTLVVYLAVPRSWPTLGEFAFLIPLLSFGLRSRSRLRSYYLATALIPLLAGAWLRSGPKSQPLAAVVLWGATSAISWLLGDFLAHSRRSIRQEERAALAIQRAEIASELHDTVAHELALIAWRAERARVHHDATDADLAFFAETANKCAADLRMILALLQPDAEASTTPDLTFETLSETLAQAERELVRHGFVVYTNLDGDGTALSPRINVALGKISREAINNMVRHAPSGSICSILATIDATRVDLLFINPTAGVPAPSSPHQQLGILGMTHRAQAAGGTLTAGPTGQQWMTRVILPYSSTTAERP